MRVGLAVERWRGGERYVGGLEGRVGVRARGVVDAAVEELRRRLGAGFSVEEIVDLYESDSAWALDLAVRRAPEDPGAWDARIIDAAFWRYLSQARDWGGGRQIVPDA